MRISTALMLIIVSLSLSGCFAVAVGAVPVRVGDTSIKMRKIKARCLKLSVLKLFKFVALENGF